MPSEPDARPRRSAARTLPILAAALSTAVALPACRPGDARALFTTRDTKNTFVVPGADHIAWDQIALDVLNPAGSVTVEVDDRLDRPVVRSRVRWAGVGNVKAWDDDNPPATVVAQPEPGPIGRAVLRVVSEFHPQAPADTEVDLLIRLPRCDGIRVRNTAGPVVLVGVGGAVTVDNGFDSRPGGRIELRTNRPLLDPVALTSTDGRITVVITEGSRGAVDLHTYSGTASFSTPRGGMRDLEPAIGRWRGVWNEGDNPIILRSGHGDVRVLVTDDPEQYSVPDRVAKHFD